MQVNISGLAGPFTISALTATTITLANVALTPTYRIVGDVTTWSPMTLTVSGYDPLLDGGVRIGGDTINVCNPSTTRLAAAPSSPGRIRRSSSTATPRRTASGTAVIRTTSLGYEFGPQAVRPVHQDPRRRERGRRVGLPAR